MIELCKQKLSTIEQEHGIRCMDCNRIMTDDDYYCRRQISEDTYEIVCVDCGLEKAKNALS